MSSSSSEVREPSDDDVVLDVPQQRRRVSDLTEHGGPFLVAVLVDTECEHVLPRHECFGMNDVDFIAARFWLVGLLTISWNLVRDRAGGCNAKILNGISKRFRVETPSA